MVATGVVVVAVEGVAAAVVAVLPVAEAAEAVEEEGVVEVMVVAPGVAVEASSALNPIS